LTKNLNKLRDKNIYLDQIAEMFSDESQRYYTVVLGPSLSRRLSAIPTF